MTRTADNRTVEQQVKSGFRLAGLILLTFVIFSLLATGLQLLAARGLGLVLGIGIVFVVTGVPFASVRWWAKWFFGACCFAALRAVVMVVLGRTMSYPSLAAPRSFFAEMFCIFAVMTLLSYRFVSAKPNRLDSVCLVGAVIVSTYALIDKKPIIWLAVAVLLLGVGAAYHNFKLTTFAAKS